MCEHLIMGTLEGKQRQNRREKISDKIITKNSQIKNYSNLRQKGYTEQ